MNIESVWNNNAWEKLSLPSDWKLMNNSLYALEAVVFRVKCFGEPQQQ